MHLLKHTRTEITIVKYQRACPYCKTRPMRKRTCGHRDCQYAHHIQSMRKEPRKTEYRYPTRTISTTNLAVFK